MKASRHARIKEIIENQTIETQEELAEALRKKGIEVTQATVSRDIKELMLIKVPTGDGRYRYAFPPEQNLVFSQSRLERAFQDSVVGMDHSLNIIVIRTVPGLAQAVAYAVDSTRWPEIIGTVGGDDTVFIVVKPPEATADVLARFRALL
jgi:transcriptional regulator of arginine metabolism